MSSIPCPMWELLPDFPADSSGKPWFVYFGDQTNVRGFWFVEGVRIQDWDEAELKGCCTGGEDLSRDFMLAENGWPLFSEGLRSLIEKAFPNAIQFLPFTYQTANSSSRRMYIGQVLHLVDGIDREKTKVDNNDWTPRVNGTFRTQHPIVLKAKEVCAFPVVHVVGNPRPIYIRDDLKDLMEKSEYSGLRFRSVLLS